MAEHSSANVVAEASASGVQVLDTLHDGRAQVVAAFAVAGAGRAWVLVESGPGSTRPTLEAALAASGRDLADLAAIFVTHVHLDHAGAAGALSRVSGAPVYVHPRGARHLADPTRLMASAAQVFGTRLHELWGDMEPVPADCLRAVADGEVVRVAGRRFAALETLGHARHHHAFVLDDLDAFVGDAAAIRLPGSSAVAPATPLPDVDLDAWAHSLDRIAAARPEVLWLTHFGPVRDVGDHLDGVRRMHEALATAATTAASTAALERRVAEYLDDVFRTGGLDHDLVERYLAASPPAVTAAGLAHAFGGASPSRA